MRYLLVGEQPKAGYSGNFVYYKSVSTKKEFVRELEFFLDLSDSLYEPEDRIRVRLDIEKGKLLNVVCQYETFENNKWIAIVRFDYSHGVFHKDTMYSNGDKEKEIVEVFSIKDVILNARG